MPSFFHFFGPPNQQFTGQLDCDRCTYIKADGQRCKRNVCIGLPVCTTHLPYRFKVKIATSLIPNSGKGLFAYKIGADDNAIVFKKDETICPYDGEIIDQSTLINRYGEYTAPYGLLTKSNPPRYEDAATHRGVGSLINHLPSKKNCKLTVNNQTGKALIKATKTIRQGEELYVSYGRDYKMNEPARYVTNNKKAYNFST